MAQASIDKEQDAYTLAWLTEIVEKKDTTVYLLDETVTKYRDYLYQHFNVVQTTYGCAVRTNGDGVWMFEKWPHDVLRTSDVLVKTPDLDKIAPDWDLIDASRFRIPFVVDEVCRLEVIEEHNGNPTRTGLGSYPVLVIKLK